MQWSRGRRLRLTLAGVALAAAPFGLAVPRAAGSSASGKGAHWYAIVTPRRNEPDPDLVRVGARYILYYSQTGIYAPPIAVTTSDDLFDWSNPVRAAMPKAPSWAIDGFTWAPDVHHFDGRWVMYFDALARDSLYFDKKADNFWGRHAQCIGIATARAPLGPFVAARKPFLCQFRLHGSIDPRVFRDADGQLFLDWKSDDNAPAPARSHETSLWAERLSADGLALVGPVHSLIAATEPWEDGLIEAPDMVHTAGRYWLFYSGNWYDTVHYDVGLARCRTAVGPCTAVGDGPWAYAHLLGPQPGEGSIYHGAIGYWFLYSPWDLKHLRSRTRPVAVAHFGFGRGGPYVIEVRART
jgi:beta-xylosidase